MTEQAKAITIDVRERIFWTLIAVLIAGFIIHFYAIVSLAKNAALRQALESELASRTTSVAALEFAYINATNNLGLSTAAKFGLTEVKTPHYLARSGATALTLNTSR